ncbi:MAG: cysteine desulfurase [Rhodospirillales bacterium]|nr:MAG: cysteine desulfurase [Rhodospirillales bacterium]
MPETIAYLDHNATTPVRPEVADAIAEALTIAGNPSSVHRSGRAARQCIERARARVAALVGASMTEVVFTSGGTEANMLAVHGTGRSRVLMAATEHASTLEALPESERIPVDGDGIVDLAALEALLQGDPRPALVCVMLANNETGTIQPVGEVVTVAHRHGALMHCDAIQAAGKIPVDVVSLGVDLLSLSAHKIGGPAGSGALIVRPGVAISPLQRGGGQERGRRAGTENVLGIAGFGAGAEVALATLPDSAKLEGLRDRLESRLRLQMPMSMVIAAGAPRLPNTTCVSLPGVASDVQVMALDLSGVAVSAGAACSSGKVGRSHVLAAMAVDERIAASTIRVSLGWTTSEHDVDRFVAAWSDLAARTAARRRDGIASAA